MTKKILSSIFILLIIVNIFAPFAVSINKNNIPVIKKTVAEAADTNGSIKQIKATENSVSVQITLNRKESSNHGFLYMVTTEPKGTTLNSNPDFTCRIWMSIVPPVWDNYNCDLKEVVRNERAGDEITKNSQVFVPASGAQVITVPDQDGAIDNSELVNGTPKGNDFIESTIDRVISLPTPNTTYYLSYWYYNGNDVDNGAIASALDIEIKTTAIGETSDEVKDIATVSTYSDPMPDCYILSGEGLLGCLAVITYYVIFNPTSWMFAKAGQFFDWAFSYSVSSEAYQDTFVIEGWGVVRDFCNIFFIFVLLYIAFATILSLHGFKTKEMIINVVIIGLLMNFSLFAAQMIIDTSNILARVFYNPQSLDIKVTEKDDTGKVIERDPKPGEPIQMSLAVVDKFDPQNLIRNAKKVNPEGGGDKSIGAGTYIIVTLLASTVNVIGFIVFLTTALIFIGRVVGLWIAMILVPLAFFSYTVPSMQDIDMIGWRKWWPNTLKLAFLGPIFMFFMYLIIKFLKIDFIASAAAKGKGMDFTLSIIVPFAFIMILMWKAKGIAQKLSGEFGSAMIKGAQIIGGAAVGATAMVGAGALRGTIGRAGSAIDKSAWVNRNAAKKGFVGMSARFFKSAGQTAGKGSMDIRGAKIAGMGLSDTGLKKMGKAKEGGFEKMRADKVAARKKRADDLKVHEDEPLKQNLNKAQVDKQKLLIESEFNISQLENQLKAARDKVKDANNELNALKTGGGTDAEITEAGRKARDANALVSQLTTTKKEIKDARGSEIQSITVKVEQAKAELASAAPEDKKKFETKVKNAQMVLSAAIASRTLAESKGQDVSDSKSINDYEDVIIPNAEHAIHHENQHRLSDRADLVQSKTNKIINFIFSGGQHSFAGDNEAAHAMRMDLKISSGGKSHGGGDHGGGHAPKAPKPKAEPKADDHGGGGHGGGHGGGGHH